MMWLLIASVLASPLQQEFHAKSDSISKSGKFRLSGYLKILDVTSFNSRFSEATSDGLVHNRLNMKWRPSSDLTISAEIRNRIFTGETIRNTPDFDNQLRNPRMALNLQKAWISNDAIVIHSNVERMYADWNNGRWQFRLGRQRINWGLTTTWNPNDIFNTYDFLDFDYEERSGSDAIYLTRCLDDQSSFTMAWSSTSNGRTTMATRYFANWKRFDFQLIAGLFNNRPVAGGGWAGHIGEAGFKGEFTLFTAKDSLASDLNLSLESDYLFSGGWYLNTGVLYNGRGMKKPIETSLPITMSLSPDNLMPAQWNMIATVGKEINPITQETCSLVFSPGMNNLILINSFRYNASTNLDLDFIWQSFFAETNSGFQASRHAVFLRIKKSF